MNFEQFLLDEIRIHPVHLAIVQRNHLASFDDLLQLTFKTASDHCQTLRRPGGIVPDPRDPNNPAVFIQNPGCPITQISERRLTLSVYAAHYYELIGRPLDAQSMTWPRFKHFDTLITVRANYLTPAALSPHLAGTPFATTMEIVENHFARALGSTRLPLAYVTRPNAVVAPIATHPLNPLTTLPYSDLHFKGFMEELITRVPHTTPEFELDNSMVYEILLKVFGKSKFVTSMHPYKHTQNGRAAYLALIQHNLGRNQYSKMFHEAEIVVTSHKYFGTNPHYTLSTHIAKHRAAHDRMRRASVHVNFAVPTEETRVLRLCDSLESSNMALLAGKAGVLGDPVKKDDFELAADFLVTIAPHCAPPKKSHQISSLKSGKTGKSHSHRGRGRGRGRSNNSRFHPYQQNTTVHQFTPTPNRGTTGVELRYYSDTEYKTLAHPMKNELRLWRKSQSQPVTISALQQYFPQPVPHYAVPPPALPPPPVAPVQHAPQQQAPQGAMIPFIPPPGQNLQHYGPAL